jgi:hypothetical protein
MVAENVRDYGVFLYFLCPTSEAEEARISYKKHFSTEAAKPQKNAILLVNLFLQASRATDGKAAKRERERERYVKKCGK